MDAFFGTWRRISWSCCQDDKDMRAQRAARFSSHLERSSTNVGGPSIPVGQRLVEIGAIIDFVTVLFAVGIITESCTSKSDIVFSFGTCLLCCKMCLPFVSYAILVNNVLFFIPYFVGPSVETYSMGNPVEKVSDIPSRRVVCVCVRSQPQCHQDFGHLTIYNVASNLCIYIYINVSMCICTTILMIVFSDIMIFTVYVFSIYMHVLLSPTIRRSLLYMHIMYTDTYILCIHNAVASSHDIIRLL